MPRELGTRPFGGEKSDQTTPLLQETRESTDKNNVPLAYEQASLRPSREQTGDRNSMSVNDSGQEREIKITLGDTREVSDKSEKIKRESKEFEQREQLQMDLTSLVQRADNYVSHTNAIGREDVNRAEAAKIVENTIHGIDKSSFTNSQELFKEVRTKIQADRTIGETTRRKAEKVLDKAEQLPLRDELLVRLDRITTELSERDDLDKGRKGDRIQKFSQTIRWQINEAFRTSKLQKTDEFLDTVQVTLAKEVQTQSLSLSDSHERKRQRRDDKQHVANEFMKGMRETKPGESAKDGKRETIGKVERLRTIWRQSMLQHKVSHRIDSYIPELIPVGVADMTGSDKEKSMAMEAELRAVEYRLERMSSEEFKDTSWLQKLRANEKPENRARYNAAGLEEAFTKLELRDEIVKLAYRKYDLTEDERMKKTITQFENTLDNRLIRSTKATDSQSRTDRGPYTKPDREATINDIIAKMTRNVNRKTFIKDETRVRKLEHINDLAAAMSNESD